MPNLPLPQPTSPTESMGWAYWARRLLVCNPFFLCSAALLLYGINRLSIDPHFLGNEASILLFNFSALEAYQLLLVYTAIVLSRRKIWYDSALLVVLSNGLLLVPFMLLSQATLISKTMAWGLTMVAGGFVIALWMTVRKWYPIFNLPKRALSLGAIILLVNMLLPMVFRPWIERFTDDWRVPNLACWYLGLPLLIAGANLLSKPARYGGLEPERHWLPLFNYGLWMIGTAVHLWTLAYICKFPFQMHFLGPVLLVATWTLFNRISDCLPNPSVTWRRGLLILTFSAPLFAYREREIFLALVALNLVAYLFSWRKGIEPMRNTARELFLGSLILLLVATRSLWDLFNPTLTDHPLMVGVALYLLLLSIRSRQMELALVGAIALALGFGSVHGPWSLHPAVQASAVFLLIHSLRWPSTPGAKQFRSWVALIWILDAAIWTRSSANFPALFVTCADFLVLLAWALAWWKTHCLPAVILPLAATFVMMAHPTNRFIAHGSIGLIALAGSLALFAIGAILAWNRQHWMSRLQSHPPNG